MKNHELTKLLREEILEIIETMYSLKDLSEKETRSLSYQYLNRINTLINHYQETNLTDFNIFMMMSDLIMQGVLTNATLKDLIRIPADKRPIVLNQLDQANYLGN